jgi:pyrimidine-nucleoside phosphorylase
VINHFSSKSTNAAEIASLAEALAKSGEKYNWPKDINPLSDIVSTGGPSSLSTLLCPYIIASAGSFVANITVPGSLAGAVDSLALIKGYKIKLEHEEMIRSLWISRIAHTMTSPKLAPADGYLFELRKQLKKKAVPALVIASLLAKKLAISNPSCLVDIRCGSAGNFGTKTEDCRKNGELLIRVAESLKISVTCVVTDISQPLMPYFGRVDSLHALYLGLLGDLSDPWLSLHIDTCIRIAAEALKMIGLASSVQAINTAKEIMINGKAKDTFFNNLISQGGSKQYFENILVEAASWKKYLIGSTIQGNIKYIDCNMLSKIFIKAQAEIGMEKATIGLKCLKSPGEIVEKNTPIMELRSSIPLASTVVESLSHQFAESFSIQLEINKNIPKQILTIID